MSHKVTQLCLDRAVQLVKEREKRGNDLAAKVDEVIAYVKTLEADRAELVKALRKTCSDVFDEFGYHPNHEYVTQILAKYPEQS
jgi:hypothetical protein